MRWYKFDITAYLQSTTHLPDAEDLAYRRLMDLYFLTEKPLPRDVHELARRIRLDWDCVQPVIEEFFTQSPEGWVHEEWETQLQRRRRQAETNRRAAQKPRPAAVRGRGRPRRIPASVSSAVGAEEGR